MVFENHIFVLLTFRLWLKLSNLFCLDILAYYLFVSCWSLGYLSYRFEVMPSPEICKKKLKVNKLFTILGTFEFSREHYSHP